MDKKIKKIILFLGIIAIFFLKIDFALAFELQYPDILGLSINDTSSFPEYARYFFNLGIALAGFIAVIAAAFGGLYYLVDFSRGKFASEGKEWIKSGVLGLLIVASAYLIAYTINPDLVVFKLGELSPIFFQENTDSPGSPGQKITIYKEVPLGILTENLLTRTMDCYDFDPEGNPIEGEQIRTDSRQTVAGPTYRDRDRVDCILNLSNAAEKKAKIISDLSNEIKKLMEICSCAGKCDSTCDKDSGCAVSGQGCAGSCVKSACASPQGHEGCCPEGVKDKIEHGPIKIGGGGNGPEKEYKGLDEFRTRLFNISILVEKQVQVEQKTITIIDKAKWNNLKLIEQLMYYKEKLAQIKSKVQADLNKLGSAKSTLNQGQCYLSTPYIDLLKATEKTRKEDNIIIAQKTFTDPETSALVDISKYCKGFNYASSNASPSCLKRCNDACPDSSEKALSCYKDCKDCSKITDPEEKKQCLTEQNQCVEGCYDSRPCPLLASDSSENFIGCIATCREQCITDCSKKYLRHSDEFEICQNRCNNNSKCVLENKDTCLIDSQDFVECANNTNDSGNAKYCIDNAYLCKYGSNQNSGYQDCLKEPKKMNTSNCSQYSASFLYQKQGCQRCEDPYCKYNIEGKACYEKPYSEEEEKSATCLDLYPKTAKCPASSDCPQCKCDAIDETLTFSLPGPSGNGSGGSGGGSGNGSSGGPCGNGQPMQVCADGNVSCYCPSGSGSGSSGGSSSGSGGGSGSGSSGGSGGGGGGGTEYSVRISAYRIVGPECGEYAYNDDPLTFYCQQSWWKDKEREGQDKTPIGKERICPEKKEVPSGQTVDNAELWASKLISAVDTVSQSLQSMISYIKKIGDKRPDQYCKCESKYDIDNEDRAKAGKPICTTDCQYNPATQTTVTNPETGEITTITIPPSCAFVPCRGNSCQQIIDYLSKVVSYYQQFKIAYINFYISTLLEGRTDVLKQLTYSRQKTDACSVTKSAYGNEARLLSCARVEDEIIAPINTGKITIGNKDIDSYCYGKELGKILNKSLTDNWFCCEEWQKETTTRKEPK